MNPNKTVECPHCNGTGFIIDRSVKSLKDLPICDRCKKEPGVVAHFPSRGRNVKCIYICTKCDMKERTGH